MRAILESKSIAMLKKMIKQTNITGYSKLNKKQIINKMLTEDKRFEAYVLKSHKEAAKKTPVKEVKKTPLKKLKPKGTHKMADGSVMSGSVHSKDSKPVKKPEPKKEKQGLTLTKSDGTVINMKMKDKKQKKKLEPKKEGPVKGGKKAETKEQSPTAAPTKALKKEKQLPKGTNAVEIKRDLQKIIINYYKKLIEIEKKRIDRGFKRGDFEIAKFNFDDNMDDDLDDIIDDNKVNNKSKDTYFFKNKKGKHKHVLDLVNLDTVFPNGIKNNETYKKYIELSKAPMKKIELRTPKQFKEDALKKAKDEGAKVVKAKSKKPEVKKAEGKRKLKGKPLGETPKYEEIKKQKPRKNNYTSSKKDDDDFEKLFASIK